MQLEPRLIIGLVRAVARHAHVAGRDALHAAVLVEQDLGGREAREDLHAQLFGLARQPTAQVPQASRIGALVVQERRRPQVRQVELALLGQHPVDVLRHRHFGQRAAVVAPLGQQLVQAARVDHRARQDVGADFAALFQHANRNVGLFLRRELFQPDRRAEAGRPRTDDHHVIRHGLAFAHYSLHLPAGS